MAEARAAEYHAFAGQRQQHTFADAQPPRLSEASQQHFRGVVLDLHYCGPGFSGNRVGLQEHGAHAERGIDRTEWFGLACGRLMEVDRHWKAATRRPVCEMGRLFAAECAQFEALMTGGGKRPWPADTPKRALLSTHIKCGELGHVHVAARQGERRDGV